MYMKYDAIYRKAWKRRQWLIMLPHALPPRPQPPRCPILAIHVRTSNLFLVNAQMVVSISSPKPTQGIRLPALLQMARHLTRRKLLRVDEAQQHLGLVDKSQHRSHCANLARQEFLAALLVRQESDADEVEEDEHGEGEGSPKGAKGLLRVVAVCWVVLLAVMVIVPVLAAEPGDEFLAVDTDGGHTYGKYLGEDGAKGDEHDEVVAVEKGFKREPERIRAGIV